VIDGIIRDFKPEAVRNPLVHQPISTTSPLPKVGSQRNMTPKNKISRIPIKNVGSYSFKFEVDDYFIKDTTISINKSVDMSVNLDEIKSGSRVVLKNLIFKRSSTDLDDESLPYLNDLLHLFKNNSGIQITIEGHTDNRGDFRSNVKLSKERSESIKNFLVLNGINKSQIKVKGFGPSKPRYSNDSEVSRSLNRRVEILIN